MIFPSLVLKNLKPIKNAILEAPFEAAVPRTGLPEKYI